MSGWYRSGAIAIRRLKWRLQDGMSACAGWSAGWAWCSFAVVVTEDIENLEAEFEAKEGFDGIGVEVGGDE
jgi:hypothetical protein